MLSIDTNVLLPGVSEGHPEHELAACFLRSLERREDVAISEFILLELYGLIRNPAVLSPPLSAAEGAELCESFRTHPR